MTPELESREGPPVLESVMRKMKADYHKKFFGFRYVKRRFRLDFRNRTLSYFKDKAGPQKVIPLSVSYPYHRLSSGYRIEFSRIRHIPPPTWQPTPSRSKQRRGITSSSHRRRISKPCGWLR